jgi:predicted transcriptional regulator
MRSNESFDTGRSSTVVLHSSGNSTGVIMSATTTLRLPEKLRERIAELAERSGKSPHTFMLEAIAEKTELEEARQAFEEEADARFAKFVVTGKAIPWSEMRAYLRDRVGGKPAQKPKASKLSD